MEGRRFEWESMGSHWAVTVGEDVAGTAFAELRDAVVSASEDFDRTYSRFIRSSLVWRLAESTGVQEVPADLVSMLRLYQRLYEASGRKLNPLVGHTIADLGYDDAYTLVPQERIRETPDLDTLVIVDDTHVELTVPALIDLGALGKGFFVDRIGEMLEERGIDRFLVDGSGDILYRGIVPLVAGLEHPHDPAKVIGAIEIPRGALCASGTNRRRWADLHHVIDPSSSAPTSGIVATWATAETATMADALASCLFFADPESIRTQFPFEYCVLYDDMRVSRSAGFPAVLY